MTAATLAVGRVRRPAALASVRLGVLDAVYLFVLVLAVALGGPAQVLLALPVAACVPARAWLRRRVPTGR
jgi:hypothetical protein